MKIWIKLLAGTCIGVLLGILLPKSDPQIKELFSYLSELAINVGRYGLLPLLFFSISIGTYELKQEQKLLRIYGRVFLYCVLSTALLVLIGSLSILIISPDRIPIIIEKEAAYNLPGMKEILLTIFPKNLFKVFMTDGSFLFPVCFLSFFLGLNFNFDRLITKPVVQFFDAMSRIFYQINSFFTELLGLGFIALSAFLIIQLRSTQELDLFMQIIVILCIDTVLIAFGIYPGILYLMGIKDNPFKWLYAIIAPALAGFVSKDSHFSLAFLIRHGKENLGIPRKIGSTTFTFFAVFGKAGTALVTTVTFIVILKSYSSLGINFIQVLWVMTFSFLVSFILGSVPGLGTIVALSILCSGYGKGVEEGYLILKPIAPLLVSFGVFLDVITSAFISLIVARLEESLKEVHASDYI
ncbi:MAG: cation:dicarboxylase symporter family transporter [Spirochaetota bacterium]